MKSAIEKIYFGEADREEIPATEEWKRLADEGLKVYEKFYPSLTEEQKKQFDEIYEYESGQEAEMILQYYKEGFKLGLMLAVEAALK